MHVHGAGQRAGQAGVRAEAPPSLASVATITTGFIQWASGCLSADRRDAMCDGRTSSNLKANCTESDLAARRRGKTYLTDPYIEMTPEVSTDSSI